MEYIAVQKEAISLVTESIERLSNRLAEEFNPNTKVIESEWIESNELARSLNLTQRTLHSYRQRGLLGFSTIGRKIYYRVQDVEKLINN